MIDWSQATQIAGIGFATVLAVLVILAVVLWIVGKVFHKIVASDGETGDNKEKEN